MSSGHCARVATHNANWCSFRLWDVPGIKTSFPPSKERSARFTALAFSPDCSRLASGSLDGTVALWDTRRPCQPIATLKLHSTNQIRTLAFSSDGGRLASGSWNSVRFWDGRDGAPVRTPEYSFSGELNSVAFSSSLLAAATDEAISLFNLETHCRIHTLDQGSSSLSFSADGSLLASAYDSFGSSTSGVTVFGVEDHTKIATFIVDSSIDRMIFSPDGSRLATYSDYGDGNFKLFDIDKKSPIQRTDREVLKWAPHLNGTLISLGDNDDFGRHLSLRFIDHSGEFPVLCVPSDVGVRKFAVGSSMFALGTGDGRIIVGQAPSTS